MLSKLVTLDFQSYRSDDPRIIALVDTSTWGHILNKPSIVEITPPGSSTKIVHYWQKKKINVFNAVNLNAACTAPCCEQGYDFLVDGVYIITLKGSPDSFYCTKNFLNTANTRLDLDKLYIEMRLECNRINLDKWQRIREVDFLISAAESNAKNDNIATAQEIFFKAQAMIEEVKDCKNCF